MKSYGLSWPQNEIGKTQDFAEIPFGFGKYGNWVGFWLKISLWAIHVKVCIFHTESYRIYRELPNTINQATTEGGRLVFSPHFLRGESPTIWSLQRQQSQDNLTKAWHMSSLAGVSNRSTPHSLAFDNDSCCWNFLANSLPFPKYRCETGFQQMQCLLSSVPMAMIRKTKMGMGCDFNR